MTAAHSQPGRVGTAAPFLALGLLCILGGGFTAAVTAHAPTEHATWACAYLVLVGGIAQVALGTGQAWLTDGAPPVRLLAAEAVTFNLGNAAVIAGTVADVPAILDLGGVLLAAALVLFLTAVRAGRQPRWAVWSYRVLIAIVLVSIPTGLVIASLHGH